MNENGEGRSYSAGDKLPESTGDKLQDSLGIWIPIFLGRLSDCAGKWFHWGICIPPGNNLRLRLSGMLSYEYLYTPLGNIEIFWGYPTSLGLTVD